MYIDDGTLEKCMFKTKLFAIFSSYMDGAYPLNHLSVRSFGNIADGCVCVCECARIFDRKIVKRWFLHEVWPYIQATH